MSQLPGLHLRKSHPQLCLTLRGETIEELSDAVRALSEYPADVIEFNAATFNGVSNFSQIGNACSSSPVRSATSGSSFPAPWPSCRNITKRRPTTTTSYFSPSARAHRRVEIESTLDIDKIDELADEATEADIMPILTIRCDGPFSESDFADKLFSAVSEDIFAYHIICSPQSDEELAEIMECLHSCEAVHEDTQFIIEREVHTGKKPSKTATPSRRLSSTPRRKKRKTDCPSPNCTAFFKQNDIDINKSASPQRIGAAGGRFFHEAISFQRGTGFCGPGGGICRCGGPASYPHPRECRTACPALPRLAGA